MGNCTSLSKKSKEPGSALPIRKGSSSGNQALLFHGTISKLKIRELPTSIVKGNPISVSFKLPNELYEFPEMIRNDEMYRWENSHKFLYEATLFDINTQRLEIWINSGNKIISSTEIKLRSLIDGPLHQNRCLTSNTLTLGRISFDIEFLQNSELYILADHISCDLRDDNIGNFTVSIKFMSDSVQESKHSYLSEIPNWDFTLVDKLLLRLPVTVKNIRDAALQIRLYKHHKSDFELAAECWVSFTKLFAQDMENIYRKESFLDKANQYEGQLDFEKAEKAIIREYFKTLTEELWLCGRKVGFVTGTLRISGMPIFVQLISGVNTENGITVQNLNIINQQNKTKKNNVPSEIRTIQKLTNRLKESIQAKPVSVGPAHERELFKKKKLIIDDLCEILSETQKETIFCYTYTSFKSLLKAQKILIELSNHLIEYAPLVTYDIKPFYFKCITLLIARGELDIGHLSLSHSANERVEEKKKIALDYCKMLHQLLTLSLSRMALKGIDNITQEYVDKSLAICWFRVPEFRDVIKELVKKKSYYSIYEWRNIESCLDQDMDHGISNALDWTPFYNLIPKDFNSASFISDLNKESWKSKFEKRGIAFFSFFEKWIEHAHRQTVSQHFIWSNIPGYKVLLSSFLIEMKEREVIEYPEALISCACKILCNPKMLNIMVRILFSKTNIYDFNTVQETFKIMNILFVAYFKLSNKLPITFDFTFFTLGIKISLEDENALNVARCLEFIYNQYHLLKGPLRKDIILDIIIQKNYNKYFFHWSKDIRNAMHHLILYRILSLKKLNFEYQDDSAELDKQIYSMVKLKLKALDKENLRRCQRPYYDSSMYEMNLLREQYQNWLHQLSAYSGKLYGVSDDFPYPLINVKLNYLDLAERKLEEQW